MDEAGFQLPNSNFGPMLGALPQFGGGGGASFLAEYPFELESEGDGTNVKVKNCRLVGGGFEYTCNDTTITPTSRGRGWIWARIDHGASYVSSSALKVESGDELPKTTARYTIRTLYSTNDGIVDVDYRWMPVIVMAS